MNRINESKGVTVKDVGFTFNVDIDPLRGRFIPKTAKDLDKLSSTAAVDKVVQAIEYRLFEITKIKWSYDGADPGAGYSFVPDEQALAQSIEAAF